MNKTFVSTLKKINLAKLSGTAKFIMIELLCEANAKSPHVFVNTKDLAERIGRKEGTIRKAVSELLKLGYLVWEGLIVQLKHKVYKLVFDVVQTEKLTAEKPSISAKSSMPPANLVDSKVVEVKNLAAASKDDKATEAKSQLRMFNLKPDLVDKLLCKYSGKGCLDLISEYVGWLKQGDRRTPVQPAYLWFEAKV